MIRAGVLGTRCAGGRGRRLVAGAARVALTLAVAALGLTACGVGGILAASAGGGGGGGGDDAKPPPPNVVAQRPPGESASNLIALAYRLRDPQVKGDQDRPGGDRDPRVKVTIEWRFRPAENAEPGPFRPLTESRTVGSEGLRNLALGNRLFIWNSVIDVGGVRREVDVRFTAEYEPAAGLKRRWVKDEIRFFVDNRLAGTVFGEDVVPTSEVSTFPVDLAPVGTDVFIASAGAGIVERLDALGRARRVVGVGLRGDTGDGGSAGVARLQNLDSIDLTAGGVVLANVGDRLRASNPSSAAVVVGEDTLPPRTIDTIQRTTFAQNARDVRVHTSGAILFLDRFNRVIALNPEDPGGGGATITLSGVPIPPGMVAVVCGGGASVVDGALATDTAMSLATSMAVGPGGEVYYREEGAARIRVFNPTAGPLTIGGTVVPAGTVLTVVGGGGAGFSGDTEPAIGARIGPSGGMDVGPGPLLLIADAVNRRVRLANLGPASVTLAGTTVDPGNIDTLVGGGTGGIGSLAREIRLASTNSVAFGVADIVLVADGAKVFSVNTGTTTVTAYGKTSLSSRTREIYDSSRRAGQPLREPLAMISGLVDEVFFTDDTTVRVLNLSGGPRAFGGSSAGSGEVAVIAGGTVPGQSGDGGPARTAAFSSPSALALDGPVALYVADTDNNRIRLLNVGPPEITGPLTVGTVTVGAGDVDTVIGSGATAGPPADGDGLGPLAVAIDSPEGVAIGSAGIVFFSDTGHHRVRCFNSTGSDVTVAGTVVLAGTVNTVFGDGTPGFSADGPGPFVTNAPTALAYDGPTGMLFIAERGNARIRALSTGLGTAGAITFTLAGVDVAVNEVRTLVGTGVPGNVGDGGGGPQAQIEDPRSIILQARVPDTAAPGLAQTPVALYFADSAHHVVRVLNMSTIDIVTARNENNQALITVPPGGIFSVAGGPNNLGSPNSPGFDGDGEPAANVRFDTPIGIAIANLDGVPGALLRCRLGQQPDPPVRRPADRHRPGSGREVTARPRRA